LRHSPKNDVENEENSVNIPHLFTYLAKPDTKRESSAVKVGEQSEVNLFKQGSNKNQTALQNS
jgi:hypothetical protein